MNFGAYARKRADVALVRDTTWVPAFTTRPPTGDEPIPVPSPVKKRAYWMWFAAILWLETMMIRRSTKTLNPGSTGAVKNTFLLHTQALNVAVHLLVDLSALRSLNALRSEWGVVFPAKLEGAPALRASEERAVVIRHFFKLLIRAPMVNCVLLGGKLDGFHAYQLKQLVMMVTSPTFFATLFAVKTTRGLSAVALVNVSFVAACALSMPFAFKYAPDLREDFRRSLGPEEEVPKRFASLAAALAVAPFASRLAVRAFRLDGQPRAAWPSGTRAARDAGWTSADDPKSQKIRRHPEEKEKEKAEEGAMERGLVGAVARLGGADDASAAREAVSLRGGSGRADRFTPELSASALCFRGSAAQSVTVRSVPYGVSLRVTFEGHVLRTTSEYVRDAESGSVHTFLRVWPPEPEGGDPGDSGSSDRGVRAAPPFGRAWVCPGHIYESATRGGERKRNGSAAVPSVETTFAPLGEAAPLLFLRDPETAREVNNATRLIRLNSNAVLANRLVMRMGNCIARATFSVNENEVMTEVTAAMGMVRCERMLRSLRARGAGEHSAAELSQAREAPPSPGGGAAEGTHAARGRRAARGAGARGDASPGTSSDDADAVDGPDAADAAGGARRGDGGETAAAAAGGGSGDRPTGGALRRRTLRQRSRVS